MRNFFIITALLFIPLELLADFSCKVEISYVWVKNKQEKTVIFKNIYSNYELKEQATIELNRLGERGKAEALKDCNRNHENLANCIVSKLKNISGTSASVGFKSRAMLEEAVEEDCKLQTGTCVSASMSEIACEEIIEPKPSETVTEEGNDKAKKKK